MRAYEPSVPEPWLIEKLERLRRSERELGLPLWPTEPLPPEMPPQRVPDAPSPGQVIVIDL